MAAILTTTTAVLLRRRLFAAGGLIILLVSVTVCRPAPCLALPSSNDDNNYYCDWCPRHSTASPDDLDALLRTTDGGVSCGYPAAAELDADGAAAPYFVAAVGADFFFRDGAGRGACYQLRCRDRRVCGDGGVKVVVVAGAANRTGFLLTREAFSAMARPGVSSNDQDQLLGGLGGNAAVQVDFRRIPCEYKNKNLSVLINEGMSRRSRHPAHELDISFLYQGGQTDIAAVEIAQSQSPSLWQAMARVRVRGSGGVAWRTSRAPAGPLQLRLVVTAGVGGKWLIAGVPVLPADWRPGQVHDMGLRVRDVALSTCARSCRARRRRRPVMVAGSEELR